MNRFEFFDSIPAMDQRDRLRIQWAYDIAKIFHSGESRDSGERYFEHVRSVAKILIDHGYTEASYLIIAFLHDTLENTYLRVSMLEQLFGPEIAREVLTVSKTYGLEDPLTGSVTMSPKRSKEEYFASIERNGKRAAIVKCADRIHNLSDLIQPSPGSRWTPIKRIEQVEETRGWILPLAKKFEPRFTTLLENICHHIEGHAKASLGTKK